MPFSYTYANKIQRWHCHCLVHYVLVSLPVHDKKSIPHLLSLSKSFLQDSPLISKQSAFNSLHNCCPSPGFMEKPGGGWGGKSLSKGRMGRVLGSKLFFLRHYFNIIITRLWLEWYLPTKNKDPQFISRQQFGASGSNWVSPKYIGSRSQWQSTKKTAMRSEMQGWKQKVWPRETKESKVTKSIHIIIK